MREDIKKTKEEKIVRIKDFGMEPYPEKTGRTHQNREVIEKFENIKEKVCLAGRVRSFRPMGNSTFTHIEDESARFQVFLNKKNMGDDLYKLFVKSVEMGDFIEVYGELFETKTGEKSLNASNWKCLAKNMRPIPVDYFGIKDREELLRKRYLDLLLNEETKEIFRKKNVFWQTIRNFLSERGFLEVQTPVLEHIPGGADAEPFMTHHNALSQDFYLRISLELALKRLLVGGYEKVFEIGRVFRNEGIDKEHLQEYDSMEFYWAYADMEKGMILIEELYKKVVKEVTGGYITQYEGQKIEWDKEWEILDYFKAFEKETGIDISEDISVQELRKKAEELKIEYDKNAGKGKLIDTIYKKTVRQKLIQPTFLVGHPIEVSPLSKKDPENPNKVLRVQVVAGKSELCNAFSELNDPMDQRRRFEEQMKLREEGDSEAQMLDEDFVEALEYGMPPAFGFGLSERFFAFIMDKSVRETVIFPSMKSKD